MYMLYISTSKLPFFQRFFSKMMLAKTLLCIQLKETNLENRPHISNRKFKTSFNDTVFQYSVDALKQCNLDMQMDLQLVPVSLR